MSDITQPVAPVIKVITAHPLVSAGFALVVIFLAMLIDALVAALTPSHRGVYDRLRSGVDRIVGGVRTATTEQPPAAPSTAGVG